MDAGLHQLQGKAEFVTGPAPANASATLPILLEFYDDKLSAVTQHLEHAAVVRQYDANNTYQYIINREEVQLSWLAPAITDMGGTLPTTGSRPVKAARSAREAFEIDRQDAQSFIERWQPRVEAMTNARHRNMLRVILGETREQQRFFEQALAGRTDLLGRRAGVDGEAIGEVLPARWIE
jgi:hypothetical protein